ncbi:MAG: tetratricopeptide repeat protein [Gallionella sp.]|nr:tetratricopeptide repeat protein [Gallionella sp.]MDD4945993.1 tetratricopeptide repeat protein [Gallionella sp.]
MQFNRTWGILLFFVISTANGATPVSEETLPLAGVQSTPESDAVRLERILQEADALMKAGNPAAAYDLLEPLAFERAGEIRYDYLLGIAALDSGKPDKATLAFERVLAMDANFAGARLDMARAYYQLGDMVRAKIEFEIVLNQNPPEAAKLTIQKYLDNIAAHESVQQMHVSGYLEGVLGQDSNVNNSTSQSQIPVPFFNNAIFTLAPSNLKTADNYAGLAAGATVSQQIQPTLAIFAGADLRQRGNSTQNRFNSISLDGRAGMSWSRDKNSLNVALAGGQYTLANSRNRDSLGVNASWNHAFSPTDQMSVFGQYMQYRFVDTAMKINDFNQSTLGAGWQHGLADGRSVLFGSVYLGREQDIAAVTLTNPTGGRADGGKNIQGIRIGAQMGLSERMELFGNIGRQWGQYGKLNIAFLRLRSDRLDDVSLGLNFHWDKLWTVRPQLSLSRNHSNIPINQYDRSDFSVTLRRDFY